jgi:benzoyl-CoA reductase subunit B
MSSQLQPLELMHELYDNRVNRFSQRIVNNPAALRRRFLAARALGKILKPLLRFENLLTLQQRLAIEMISSQSLTADVLWALHPINQALKKYLEGIFDCAENRSRPLTWLEWCVSTDLLLAFDAQPMCTEGLVAILLILQPGVNEKLIDVGEQAGVPVEYCSASKNAIGAYLADQLPQPDCIVTSSHPCDSMVSSYQTLEYLSGVPTFRLDTPYWDDQRSLDYYAGEIRRLIAFLEDQFNRRLDYDRLRKVLTEVNMTNELLIEVNEMYRAKPCPGSIVSTVLSWVARVIGLGTPEVTETARRLHKITKERYQRGRGTIRNEKIRVIWYDVPIAFYPLVLWMEETFGATIVMDVVSYIDTPPIDTTTEESMVRGLAESYMNLAMARQFHGPVDFYLRDLNRICQDYSGDCFIFAGHAGCKHAWASTRIIKDYMKKIGMPLLVLSSDIFDRRVIHEDQLKAQIEEFFVSNGLA